MTAPGLIIVQSAPLAPVKAADAKENKFPLAGNCRNRDRKQKQHADAAIAL